MQIKCCKNCKDRYLGCHDKCSTYQESLQMYRNEKEYVKKICGCYRSSRTVQIGKGVIKSWH